MDAKSMSLKDAAIAVSVPDVIGGARIKVVDHSSNLIHATSLAHATRFSTRPGKSGGKATLILEVTPSKRGKILMSGLVELVGKSVKALRRPPVLSGHSSGSLDHQTYVEIKNELVLTAK
jgi:hypothetical protein